MNKNKRYMIEIEKEIKDYEEILNKIEEFRISDNTEKVLISKIIQDLRCELC